MKLFIMVVMFINAMACFVSACYIIANAGTMNDGFIAVVVMGAAFFGCGVYIDKWRHGGA